jgi:hypothetical protein
LYFAKPDYFPFGMSYIAGISNISLIGWLIPGIIANDMYKQGIPRTLLAAATVTALIYLFVQGLGIAFK